jgi:hypothetical protein
MDIKFTKPKLNFVFQKSPVSTTQHERIFGDTDDDDQ